MRKSTTASLALSVVSALFFFSSIANAQPPFHWQGSIYAVPPPVVAYDVYDPYPSRVPYPIQSAPGYFYFYDPVNRPFAFTPEPIWRAMFPGIKARISTEELILGVPGQAAKEL